jgi:hypothetical protein
MANHKPLYQVGDALLRQLRTEALLEQQADDDTTYPPDADPLASAQSRRALVSAGAGE